MFNPTSGNHPIWRICFKPMIIAWPFRDKDPRKAMFRFFLWSLEKLGHGKWGLLRYPNLYGVRLGSHSKNVILVMVTAIGKLDRHNKNRRFVAQHRWMIGKLLFLEVDSYSHWQYFEKSWQLKLLKIASQPTNHTHHTISYHHIHPMDQGHGSSKPLGKYMNPKVPLHCNLWSWPPLMKSSRNLFKLMMFTFYGGDSWCFKINSIDRG